MTQIVPNGGSRTSQDQYVGPNREITVDDSNKELRLHDGSTPGGVRIPNIDTNDSKYQKRSVELDGFTSFDPNASGFLFRVGSANYKLRRFTAGNGIVIENSDGLNGNPSFAIAEKIGGDHEFGGDQIIRGVLQVDGGINADISGDITGNITGNLTGNSTGSHVGAVDVRGKTLQLDADQIPQTAVNGLDDALGAITLPIGAIILWSGTLVSIPNRWHLCDGTNGTPDLRERFVTGAAVEADMHTEGGSTTHTHVATAEAAGTHKHDATVASTTLTIEQMPSHQHNNGIGDAGNELWIYGGVAADPVVPDSVDNADSNGTRQGRTSLVGGGQPHTHLATTADAGNHTHAIAVTAQNHLPPFYALAYIMKIS